MPHFQLKMLALNIYLKGCNDVSGSGSKRGFRAKSAVSDVSIAPRRALPAA
jgi:hypothetical protein